MSRDEHLVAAVIGIVLSLLCIVVFIHVNAEDPHKIITKTYPSRPEICQKYYRDGTDEWKSCMGVGIK